MFDLFRFPSIRVESSLYSFAEEQRLKECTEKYDTENSHLKSNRKRNSDDTKKSTSPPFFFLLLLFF